MIILSLSIVWLYNSFDPEQTPSEKEKRQAHDHDATSFKLTVHLLAEPPSSPRPPLKDGQALTRDAGSEEKAS